ncbi:aerobic respiration two-component sensor histidine kinase ArcB [Candidatus Fukatsuia symbiotica]|uniref:Aerobic respiration control sensor protein n=1 Tax=Candidatus Fukatsuia symbiotica TaxID=1878942 RepID=A0A2U8I6P2_9GAMM|nr:aerobic respiration two-component sensor histidine kinase ArcB [Candidatus Fukatsuia symbiotica]AWK14830.1 aerobic respiration two-component sensor histidine kinase ArcB [Candidatus Fukatsuia symbiotica]MEA9445170.1 aerobic respiration two-component sensor histidine kinase ArcB [Candidatus Fukatsuia symbiotica]
MNKIKGLAQHYVDLMVKLGLVRFSLLLASALVTLAILVQMTVTLLLRGSVESVDIVRSIFFGLLITPWAVYFLSVVVEQLEEARQRLSRLVDKLAVMRYRDMELNRQLTQNIAQLNQEIVEREKAEKARTRVVAKLKEEMEQRKQAQIELSQQSSLLRSFLNASPDLVYYRDENHKFSGCNRAIELLLGKSERQLVGLTPKDVYPSDIAAKVLATDEKVLQHNLSLTYELWLTYPDGRKACFELRKVPFYDQVGKRRGLMGFGRDITERKRYQDALENASRDKTTFISTISHELRTPLNGIVGLSRILLDTELNAEQLKYLKTIHVSAITLGNIFNDIIEMDKLEQRKVRLDNKSIDFISFMMDLENLSGLLVQPKNLQFVMEPQVPLPKKIITDGTRLRQILWNLISNAVKFTEQGRIVLRVCYEANNQLIFAVEDSGVGIAEDEQDKIFAMYYQVKDCHGRSPATGTGIGLAVSKRLAESMGGDITVKSTPGLGSCFTLSIKATTAETVTQVCDNLPLSALHVLLVEDIELNVVVARSVLEKLGYSVEVAMNGQDALAMFNPNNFDLVLLDIQLPDMSGLDIARKIRSDYKQHPLPPLVALTANVLKDRKEYLDAGMDDVLSKPLSVTALTRMIKQLCYHQPYSDTEKQEYKSMQICKSLLDIEILEQYLELVGSQLIHQSLLLFEKMMPDYLAVLDSNMTARDQNGIAQQAHKIKGAAGSVGLRHLQQLAQQIQTPSLPAWWDNVQDWIDELKLEWRNDVQILREWLVDAEKNSPDRSRGAPILRQHQGNT